MDKIKNSTSIFLIIKILLSRSILEKFSSFQTILKFMLLTQKKTHIHLGSKHLDSVICSFKNAANQQYLK